MCIIKYVPTNFFVLHFLANSYSPLSYNTYKPGEGYEEDGG